MAGVALQLYTLRDECELDLERTLHTVGGLGYEGVELWQLHGHDARRVRGWLDDAGLTVAGRHATAEELGEQLDVLADELRALGTDRVTLSWIEPSQAAVATVASLAEAATAAGLRFGFHNHDPEVQPLDGGGDVPRPAPGAAGGADLARARPRLDLVRGSRSRSPSSPPRAAAARSST